jgi:hypothetical protein
MDPIVSLHYYAPVCAVINACIIPFTEGLAPFYELGKLGPFVMFTNAGIAFALNVSDGDVRSLYTTADFSLLYRSLPSS